jgi:predicted ferric reductase
MPTVLTLHTTGMAILVGASWVLDLRLLGLNKHVPLSNYRWVFRAVAISLVVNLITGVLLFMKNATGWGTAFPFLMKMLFVVASAATILPIRTYVLNSGAGPTAISDRARMLEIASIVAWTAAVTAGRLIA